MEMQITNRSVGSAATMLSTHLTIDDEEIDSSTAAVPAVIDTDNDNVAAGDQLSIDGISAGTDTVWFQIQMAFQLP